MGSLNENAKSSPYILIKQNLAPWKRSLLFTVSKEFDIFFQEYLRWFPVCCLLYHPELSRNSFLYLLSLYHLLAFPANSQSATQSVCYLSVWDFKHGCLRIIKKMEKRPLKKAAPWASNLPFWSLSAPLEAALLLPSPAVSTATSSASKSGIAAGDVWLLTGS